MTGAVLAVEVGGTTIRVARYDPKSQRLLGRRWIATPNYLVHRADPRLEDRVADAIGALARDALEGATAMAIGLAWPGPVDPAGRILASPTVYGPHQGRAGAGGADAGSGDVGSALRRRWPDSRVTVVNDLTAAGQRYVLAGMRDFAILTVGSGIGHKVFLDGRPQVGQGGRGGELGHLRIDPSDDAPFCDCGGRGHIGGMASGRGTVAAARRRAGLEPAAFRDSRLAARCPEPATIDAPGLAAAFAAEDPFTVEVVRTAAGPVGLALAALHLGVGLERFVVIGGFAQALGEPYRRLLAAAAADASWAMGQDWDAMVRLGEPDDDSGLLGVGALAAEAAAVAARARGAGDQA